MDYDLPELAVAWPTWVDRHVWGPPCLGKTPAAIEAGLDAYAGIVEGPNNERLWTYWRELVAASGALPVYSPKFRQDLSDLASYFLIRERVGETPVVRVRYVGTTWEQRINRQIPAGASYHEAVGDTVDSYWGRAWPVYLEGRPLLTENRYPIFNKSFLRSRLLELPCLDRLDGKVHVTVTVGDILP